jgi:hypothetical protein
MQNYSNDLFFVRTLSLKIYRHSHIFGGRKMELYKNLIDIIGADLHPELEKRYSGEKSLHARIISDLLKNPEITSKQMQDRYAVSEGTFNKTLTQVKDALWDFNARYITTTYDDIFVLRQILLSGKIKNVLRLFNALRKTFETTQQWDKLDCLYIEGLRYAQITGDEEMAVDLSMERKKNSIRLHAYTMLYSEIIPEMIRLENYKLKKFDSNYAYYIEGLYVEAMEIAHHLLIHNALHIKYLLYCRFKNTPENVFSIVNVIKSNAETYKGAMANRGFGDPEEYAKSLKKLIHHGGRIAMVNFYYSMLEYSLFEKKINSINTWLIELEKIEDQSKFSQYRYIVLAVKAFIEKDLPAFTQNFTSFYHDPTHLNFPDLEITLRLLEAMVYIYKREGDMAVSRLTALRVFMGRNVDKERYLYERTVITLLSKINEGRKDVYEEIKLLEKSPYRNIYFIVSTTKEWFKPFMG